MEIVNTDIAPVIKKLQQAVDGNGEDQEVMRALQTVLESLKEVLNDALRANNAEPIEKLQQFFDGIAQAALVATQASFALLYLTPDHKILEAVGRAGDPVDRLHSTQLPFYRLDWDNAPGYEEAYNGFTAWAALHVKPGEVGVMRWDDLRTHPAHKGLWDPVVWKGSPEGKILAIMFAPIVSDQDNVCNCFGLIKVELSQAEAMEPYRSVQPFKPGHKKALRAIAQFLTKRLDRLMGKQSERRRFWRLLTERSAEQKVQHLMAVLRNWRSAQYNIAEALGYVTEFFRLLVGSDNAVMLLRRNDPSCVPTRNHPPHELVYAIPYWRPTWRANSQAIRGRKKLPYERETIPKPKFRCQMPEEWSDDRTRLGFLPVKCEAAELAACFPAQSVSTVRQAAQPMNFIISASCGEAPCVRFVPGDPDKIQQDEFRIRFNNPLMIDLAAGRSNFGTVITETPPKFDRDNTTPQLASYAVSLARTLDRILGSEFGVQVSTCLPRHWPTGPRLLAMVFADIRNFSAVTRILRLMGPAKDGAIELFMEHYCLEMARLANSWGRLDGFSGDGLLALFGETLLPVSPSTSDTDDAELNEDQMKLVVATAVCFAAAAYKRFCQIKHEWLEDKLTPERLPWSFPRPLPERLLLDIEKHHCENIQLDFGVAVSLGRLYMDYFGDTHHRRYSAIGDNVNLCARLCEEASRFDEKIDRHRAPILVTQPVFAYLDEFLKQEAQERAPLHFYPRGIGLEYLVYELWPDDLQYLQFKKCFENTPYALFLDTVFDYT